jgi:hypothetical protein
MAGVKMEWLDVEGRKTTKGRKKEKPLFAGYGAGC